MIALLSNYVAVTDRSMRPWSHTAPRPGMIWSLGGNRHVCSYLQWRRLVSSVR